MLWEGEIELITSFFSFIFILALASWVTPISVAWGEEGYLGG